MKFLDEYRNPALVKRLAEKIWHRSTKTVKLMEFCGGHTVAILKHGIQQLLPPQIQLRSGPGCPVCVTAKADLDKAIALAKLPGVISATFGDMLKVPGSNGSLQKVRAEGGDVRVVYSARDALQMAQRNPEKQVVFFGIGFETTAPTVAASILEAKEEAIKNYYVLGLHKLCPPVMKSLLDSREVGIDGIICPGHVSAVIGSDPYAFIPRDYGIACVISGFEPVDVLLSIDMLIEQIEVGRPEVEIAYRRGVKWGGNREALRLMESVFEVSEAHWRGMGRVADSGLRIRDEYQRFNAEHIFDIDPESTSEPTDCICGDILRAAKTPFDCRLLGKGCTPEHPVGPCMVSSEGSCAAHLLYGAHGGR
jgi:hydrogenase expression/formation protein HypD